MFIVVLNSHFHQFLHVNMLKLTLQYVKIDSESYVTTNYSIYSIYMLSNLPAGHRCDLYIAVCNYLNSTQGSHMSKM